MTRPRTNWACNITFGAPGYARPSSLGELQAVVARADRLRVLGTGHSFNDMADSPGAQVSVAGLPGEVSVDSARSVARVAAGLSYAQVAARLDARGFALPNLASLPHISVAGACATATHGSGVANQNLAAAVAGLRMVTAGGDVAELAGDDGAVVHLGALGVVVSLDLRLVPSFELSQRVYEDLPLEVLDAHFADLMTGAYSVSMFTDWRAPRLTQLWFKQRLDPRDPPPPPPSAPPASSASPAPSALPAPSAPPAPSTPSASLVPEVTLAPWFTATPALSARNPVPGASPDACTEQLGVPGPWYQRLPHFRPEFMPSAGDELQSEYLLPAAHAVPALRALADIRDRLAPVLRICEIRAVAADDLWLSTSYRRDSVAFHFTWIADPAAVLPVVGEVERALAPFTPPPALGQGLHHPARRAPRGLRAPPGLPRPNPPLRPRRQIPQLLHRPSPRLAGPPRHWPPPPRPHPPASVVHVPGFPTSPRSRCARDGC